VRGGGGAGARRLPARGGDVVPARGGDGAASRRRGRPIAPHTAPIPRTKGESSRGRRPDWVPLLQSIRNPSGRLESGTGGGISSSAVACRIDGGRCESGWDARAGRCRRLLVLAAAMMRSRPLVAMLLPLLLPRSFCSLSSGRHHCAPLLPPPRWPVGGLRVTPTFCHGNGRRHQAEVSPPPTPSSCP
jgi:hypothetical protein